MADSDLRKLRGRRSIEDAHAIFVSFVRGSLGLCLVVPCARTVENWEQGCRPHSHDEELLRLYVCALGEANRAEDFARHVIASCDASRVDSRWAGGMRALRGDHNAAAALRRLHEFVVHNLGQPERLVPRTPRAVANYETGRVGTRPDCDLRRELCKAAYVYGSPSDGWPRLTSDEWIYRYADHDLSVPAGLKVRIEYTGRQSVMEEHSKSLLFGTLLLPLTLAPEEYVRRTLSGLFSVETAPLAQVHEGLYLHRKAIVCDGLVTGGKRVVAIFDLRATCADLQQCPCAADRIRYLEWLHRVGNLELRVIEEPVFKGDLPLLSFVLSDDWGGVVAADQFVGRGRRRGVVAARKGTLDYRHRFELANDVRPRRIAPLELAQIAGVRL
jgi:hypothetical protein